MPDGDLPLPDLELDLPEPPAPAAAPAEESFSVHIGAIRDPVDSAPQIASILGVDAATAARLCMAAPGELVAGLPRAEPTARPRWPLDSRAEPKLGSGKKGARA